MKIEYYIGCFKSLNMPEESRIKKTLQDCLSRCVGTPFYGMRAVSEDYHDFVTYK